MGATNIEQIDQNVGALDIVIPEECMKEIVSVRALTRTREACEQRAKSSMPGFSGVVRSHALLLQAEIRCE